MNIPATALPPLLETLALLLFLALLGRSLLRAPWGLLRLNRLEHLYAATIPLLMLLWSMRTGFQPGLEFHLLGVMALVLVFGPPLAFTAAAAAVLGLTALGTYDWWSLGSNGLVLAALPVLVADRIQRLIWRWLPHHLFVYLLGNGFFGAMLTSAAVLLCSTLLLTLTGGSALNQLGGGFLGLLPLIMFPEGFITGMIMTMLVVYRPDWVRSLDDREYLSG